MLDALARHNVKKMLFDGREITGEPALIETFYYGEFVAQAVKEFADRVCPVPQNSHMLSKSRC